MKFFQTFRGRLLFILAILLVVTLGVQFYLNLRTEWANADLREQQEQALVAGIALGVSSLSSTDRIDDIVKKEGQPFFDEQTRKRIADVIVVNNEWEISDSLKPAYWPVEESEGELKLKPLKEVVDLPPLMDAESLGDDRFNFPNIGNVGSGGNGEAHAIPIETSQGRFYVMVVLESDKGESLARAAEPLIYNLAVLLISTLITIFLVRRFTRPVANLSEAARKVAAGDLSVRVEDSWRTDEMGQLAAQFNDMTRELEKNKELESKLQQAEKSAVVGRLASAIAHEIRNPLNYINLTLDHVRAKFRPNEKDKEEQFEKLTSQLKSEVGRINTQISDFLRYSRPLTLDIKPVDIRKLIDDSLRIVEAQAEEQGITISVVEEEGVERIAADSDILRSVFNNLYINAVQAIENGGGSLNTRIMPDGDLVKVEICDTGGGITEENLPKIFEPYFSTKETGTGLGLAIARRIVEEHKGTIEARSEVGTGTKFTVRLPKAN